MKRKLSFDDILDPEGRLLFLPLQPKLRKAALDYVASRFYPQCEYSDLEVDDILDATHVFDEIDMLKNELIRHKYIGISRRRKYIKMSA